MGVDVKSILGDRTVVSTVTAAEGLSKLLGYDISNFMLRAIVHEEGLGDYVGNSIALDEADLLVIVAVLEKR